MSEIPKVHPKRADLFWKIGRSVDRLKDEIAEELAYAAASHADEYSYDVLNIGEAARALNIVFEVAQKFSSTTKVQQVLVGSMARAADDTFARRLWEYTKDKERNKVLTNLSNVNTEAVKNAFIERMRNRYASRANASIAQGDWWAFRIWGENSEEDRTMAYAFWRQYVGHSQKRLAQAFNFVFPPNTTWDQDPTPILDSFFPVKEMGDLFETSTIDGNLDESEEKAVERFRNLLKGKWFDITRRDI